MSKRMFKSMLALMAGFSIGGLTSPAVMSQAHAAPSITSVYHVKRRFPINAYRNKRLSRKQAYYQRNSKFMRQFRRHLNGIIKSNRKAVMREPVQKDNHSYTNARWFKDGLSKQNLKARNWVSFHESGHRWNVLSYGGVCIGYFQLDPGYLGYKHHKVNLNHKHQIKVADAYVKMRYGSWVKAQKFWKAHNWY